jgi:SAM-dependent methyltransferase
MRPGIDELDAFYATPDGRRTALALRGVVAALVRRQANARLLAVGYATPALGDLDPGTVERLALAMPAAQGVRAWPPAGSNCAVLVDERSLPFPGAAFDQAIVCHAIEFGEAAPLLTELWRALAPAGELIAVVANRAGLWTHFERTPFGQGQPYGRGGLGRLLRAADFEPVAWRTVLVAPPLRGLRRLDRVLTRALPTLGGVHVVRARKAGGPARQGLGRVQTVPATATATALSRCD